MPAPRMFSSVWSTSGVSWSLVLTTSSLFHASLALGHSRSLCWIVSLGSGQFKQVAELLSPNRKRRELENISP